MAVNQPVIVNGWTLYSHPLFKQQYDELALQVTHLKKKDPKGFVNKSGIKRFAAIHKLIFEVIPKDPKSSEFRQSTTLSDNYKH